MIKASQVITYKGKETFLGAEWLPQGDLTPMFMDKRRIFPLCIKDQGNQDSKVLFYVYASGKYFIIASHDDPEQEAYQVNLLCKETLDFVNERTKSLQKIPESVLEKKWSGKPSISDLSIKFRGNKVLFNQNAFGSLLLTYNVLVDIYSVHTHEAEPPFGFKPIDYIRAFGIFLDDHSKSANLLLQPTIEVIPAKRSIDINWVVTVWDNETKEQLVDSDDPSVSYIIISSEENRAIEDNAASAAKDILDQGGTQDEAVEAADSSREKAYEDIEEQNGTNISINQDDEFEVSLECEIGGMIFFKGEAPDYFENSARVDIEEGMADEEVEIYLDPFVIRYVDFTTEYTYDREEKTLDVVFSVETPCEQANWFFSHGEIPEQTMDGTKSGLSGSFRFQNVMTGVRYWTAVEIETAVPGYIRTRHSWITYG